MKKISTTLTIAILLFSTSCQAKNGWRNAETSTAIADTITKIIPDDYPVTDSMFKGNYDTKECDKIISLDKVWFTNDTLNQTLVFELYTDYHRFLIFHFNNDDIPEELVNAMDLNVTIRDTATLKQKQNCFKEFINLSKKISQTYFTTFKGFKLGDKKQKALDIYGMPDNYFIPKDIERCEWWFEGDIIENKLTMKMKDSKPLATDSFGFRVTMFFRDDILIAMILANDIP